MYSGRRPLLNLSKSIDEDWYKMAVFYHSIDSESFVFSLINQHNMSEDGVQLLATYAVFPRDAGREAPGLVLGVVFGYSNFMNTFFDVIHNPEQKLLCTSGEYDCIALDHFGYIIISKDFQQVGKFFGEFDGAIMEKLIDDGVFGKTVINDSQKMCNVQELVSNTSYSLINVSNSNYIQKIEKSCFFNNSKSLIF